MGFVVVFGMMTAICIPSPGKVNRSFGDSVADFLHNLGVVMLTLGYSICELRSLQCGQKKEAKSTLVFKRGEKCVRLALVFSMLLCGVAVIVCKSLQPAPILQPNAADWSASSTCADEYRYPSSKDIAALEQNLNSEPSLTPAERQLERDFLSERIGQALASDHALLYNTASGGCLQMKVLCWMSELLGACLLTFSHLAIWWFAREREAKVIWVPTDPTEASH